MKYIIPYGETSSDEEIARHNNYVAFNLLYDETIEKWEKLLDLTWHKFPQLQVFIDSKNFRFVMKRLNEDIVFVNCFWDMLDLKFIEFVERIKIEAFNQFKTKNISIVFYASLDIELSLLEKFPKNIKYFRLEDEGLNQIDLLMLKDEIETNIKLQESYSSNKRSYKNQPKKKGEPVDWEAIIMGSLNNGEGDRFGF